jgi:hypothetical protein
MHLMNSSSNYKLLEDEHMKNNKEHTTYIDVNSDGKTYIDNYIHWNKVLIIASEDGDLKNVINALDKGAYIDTAGGLPLSVAIEKRRFTVAKYLIEHGAYVRPYRPGDKIYNINNIELVKLLFSKGLEYHPQILYSSVQFCNFDMIKYLVEELHVDISHKYYKFLSNKLCNQESGTEEQKKNILKYLIKHGLKYSKWNNIFKIHRTALREIKEEKLLQENKTKLLKDDRELEYDIRENFNKTLQIKKINI